MGGRAEGRLGLGEGPGPAEDTGLDERLGGELEGFEPLERLLEPGPADDDPVVFQDHAVGPGRERLGDILAQRGAAGQSVGGEPDGPADLPGLVQDARVGDFPADAEGHQGDGMRVDDPPEVGPLAVDRPVERELGRRAMGAFVVAVGPDPDDVVAPEIPLVETGRGDPDRAVVVEDRDVPARRGGHPVAVDPPHDPHNLVAGMDQLARLAHSRPPWFVDDPSNPGDFTTKEGRGRSLGKNMNFDGRWGISRSFPRSGANVWQFGFVLDAGNPRRLGSSFRGGRATGFVFSERGREIGFVFPRTLPSKETGWTGNQAHCKRRPHKI